MKFSKLLSTFVFMMVLGFAASRVRPPKQFQHPPILKRPSPSLSSNVRKTTTTTTSTTPEPAEVDDDVTPYARRNYNVLPYYDYDPMYDLGLFGFGGGSMVGGASYEVEDAVPSRNSAPRGQGRNGRGRQQRRPPTAAAPTTAQPITEKPTTPEPDDDFLQAAGASGAAGSGGLGASGYCFCSPLSVCPHGSISRGGFCWNILSYLTNLTYQRCCYRPSVAKWMVH